MSIYKETSETWNKMAELYQQKFMDLDIYNQSYDAFCSLLHKSNASILEIGCGPGNITKYLLDNHPDYRILGIDVAPNMIALAKTNNPKAHFEVKDCREIDDLANTFDGIICGFCLPYIDEADAKKFIVSCYDKLNHDGALYISFVEGNYADSAYKTGTNGNRVYFHYYSLEQLQQWLRATNFEEPTVMKVTYEVEGKEPDVHTIVLTKKKKV